MVDVSIVVPCRNEEKFILGFLQNLSDQKTNFTYEVIIADGISTDATRAIVGNFSKSHTLIVKIVDNSAGSIPSGLNIAVRNSVGKFIVRLDVHCSITETYIQDIVTKLDKDYFIVGPTIQYLSTQTSKTAQTIVSVLNSFLGNGGTPSRNKINKPRTVYHAVMSSYRREVFEAIGGYDENLYSNEDFEFDFRATLKGYKVTALPQPTYFAYARDSVFQFWQQRFRYGFWKTQVLKLHPQSIHLRQLVPFLFFITVLFSLFIVPRFAFFLILLYFTVVFISFYRDRNKFETFFLYFIIMFVNHFAWTLGLICGIFYFKKT
jgi:succinoglycan biosynthesis protein ExoA